MMKSTLLLFILVVLSQNIMAQTSPIIRALENGEKVNVKKTKLSGRYDEISPTFNYHDNYLYYVLGTGAVARTSKKNTSSKGTLDIWRVSFNDKLELGEPEKISGEINSRSNDGPICFYEGGKKLILTRNALFNKKTQSFEAKDNKSFFIPLQLFSMELVGKEWKNISLLDINKSKYSYAHPTISPSGKKLIFSSNNPNSYGNHDLFISELEGDGKWSKPKNLGKKINSKNQEVFPYFIDEDNILFSSNNHGEHEDLDIFKVNLSELIPKQLSWPINSPGDDFGVTIFKDKRHWLLSSNRKDANGMDDIFMVWVDEVIAENSTSLKNNTTSSSGNSNSAIVWGFPNEYKGLLGNKNYNEIIKSYFYEKPASTDMYIINTKDNIKDRDILELNMSKSDLSKGNKVVLGPYTDIMTIDRKRKELIVRGYINSKICFYKDNVKMKISKVKELLAKNK